MHLLPAQQKAYDQALKRKYKAVAFDIDGTLTPFGRWLIPDSLRQTLQAIPSNVPLALCTGRPLDYIQRQLHHLWSTTKDPKREQNRWYVLAENGGAGYHLDKQKQEFTSFFEITWPDHHISQEALHAFIKDKFGWHVVFVPRAHSVVLRFHAWIYFSRRLTRVLSARTANALRKLLKETGHADHFSVQDSGIGSLIIPTESGKGKAIHKWAKHLGVSPKDILVIGDQPRSGGNDEEFLNGRYGTPFTVGGLTHTTYPLPVLDSQGRQVKGPEGTEGLLKRVF